MPQEFYGRVGRASAIMLILGVSQHAGAERVDGPLVLEVLPTSQKVVVGEPINLTFRLRNVGNQSALVDRRFLLYHTVWLEITNAAGEKAEWCGRMTETLLRGKDFVILAAGAKVEKTVRVSCDNKRVAGYALGDVGEYVVRARYELAVPPRALEAIARDALIVRGPVEAPPVQLEVVGH
jgi:hypothetical protein